MWKVYLLFNYKYFPTSTTVYNNRKVCLHHKKQIYSDIVVIKETRQECSPSGISIAPTTAPNVLWTASPTFLASSVPPSSSKAASSNSAQQRKNRKHQHKWSNTLQRSLGEVLARPRVPVGIPLFWKHASQTRTGARPQPLSGTGLVLEEQASQKPSPHARQWCLVSLGWNSSAHLWHFWNTW